MEKYYAENYYSYRKPIFPKENKLKYALKRKRTRYYLKEKDFAGKVLAKIIPTDMDFKWYRKTKVDIDSKIIDVGCGSGDLLIGLRSHGFSNLKGIDKFIDDDISYENGVKILKKSIFELNDKFDLVMLHHSFEHMAEPLNVLTHIYKILEPDRYALIRIPIARSFAWRKYGVNWVQLDAPRHLFLHRLESMRILSSNSGFIINDIEYDSASFQFWGSEQYSRDIPLSDPRSYQKGLENSIFTELEIKNSKKITAELNSNGEGDSACFYLYKS